VPHSFPKENPQVRRWMGEQPHRKEERAAENFSSAYINCQMEIAARVQAQCLKKKVIEINTLYVHTTMS